MPRMPKLRWQPILPPGQRNCRKIQSRDGRYGHAQLWLFGAIRHRDQQRRILVGEHRTRKKIRASGFDRGGFPFHLCYRAFGTMERDSGSVDDQGRILARGIFTHVAMAGPGAAPYGWAAVQFRRNKGLWDAILSKLVTGKSNAQAYEFVKIGGAEIGFVALSQVIDKRAGSGWKVPARSHASITAAGSIVKARGGQQSRQGIY